MMPDYPLGETIDFKFTSRDFDTGAPATLAGTPAVEVYEDNSTTQITAGITLTVDFDTVTGLNNLRIVATGANGFESGKSYAAVISAGTVDGVSVVGEVVAQFSIERSPALRPTTAGRTLDVTATGAAGIDWGNVENPTTAVDLSATDIQLCDTVTTNTDMRGTDNALLAASAPTNFGDLAITATTGQVTVGTNNDKTGYSISGTKTTLDDLNDLSEAQVNAQVDTALVDIGLDHIVSASVAGTDVADNSIAARLVSSAATADWDTFDHTTDSLQAISDSGGGGPTADQIADAVWDEAQADHTAAGTFGEVATEIASILEDTGTTLEGHLTDIKGATWSTTDSLEAIRDRGDVAWLTATGFSTHSAADVRADLDANSTQLAAIVEDTNELQTDLTDGGRLDLLIDGIKAITDAIGATAAANLAKTLSNAGVVSGTAQTGTLTTNQMTTDLTEATDDHFIGRVIIWTTGVLLGQASDITDYAGSNGLLTFTAVTEAPSNGDEFVIV